jgi:hypothetical protein
VQLEMMMAHSMTGHSNDGMMRCGEANGVTAPQGIVTIWFGLGGDQIS